MRKAAFVYYDTVVRQMSGGRDSDAATAEQFAIADAVDGLWNDWLGSDNGRSHRQAASLPVGTRQRSRGHQNGLAEAFRSATRPASGLSQPEAAPRAKR